MTDYLQPWIEPSSFLIISGWNGKGNQQTISFTRLTNYRCAPPWVHGSIDINSFEKSTAIFSSGEIWSDSWTIAATLLSSPEQKYENYQVMFYSQFPKQKFRNPVAFDCCKRQFLPKHVLSSSLTYMRVEKIALRLLVAVSRWMTLHKHSESPPPLLWRRVSKDQIEQLCTIQFNHSQPEPSVLFPECDPYGWCWKAFFRWGIAGCWIKFLTKCISSWGNLASSIIMHVLPISYSHVCSWAFYWNTWEY